MKRIQATPDNSDARNMAISDILKPDQHAACVAFALARTVQNRFIHDFEAARTDKQAGAGAGSGGGSSVVTLMAVAS